MFDQNTLAQLEADYRTHRQSQPKTQPKKKGNWATNLIPTATSILGGVAGTVFAPGAGTAAGGAAGGLIGTKLRNLITGEEDRASDYLGEAALGTLGGLSRGVKSTYGAIKAARGDEGAKRAAEILRYGRQGADQRAATNPTTILSERPGKIKSAAMNTSQEGFGLTVGQSTGRGKVLTPGSADSTYDFITNGAQKYGGIRPGKPINQARDAQSVFNNVVGSLDNTLAQVNRPLQQGEASVILSSAANKASQSAAVTGTTKTLGKFGDKINSAKSLDELEKIRREADDLAFTQSGAGKTSAAAQAHAVRDAIDEFISPLSPEYKAIKGDYTVARDALEATSKANKNAKGITIPLINKEVGKQTISGVQNRAAARLSEAGKPQATEILQESAKSANPSALRAGVSMASMQLPVRALTSGGGEPSEADTTQAPTTPPIASDILSGGQQQPKASSSMYSQENAAADLQRDLMQTGGANMDKIMKLYEFLNPAPVAGANKPLSAEAAKVVSNANSGLTSLDQLQNILTEDPSARVKTVLPGRGLFGGLGASVLGTSSYDTAARNIADVITRLRTGAALTESEEAFYKSQLPQAFDPPETVAQKMSMFRDLFESVASRQPSYSESSANDILAGAY